MSTHPRAGTPTTADDLVDLSHLVTSYFALRPDPNDPTQRVSFGTSGHRGSSLDGSFNESHVAAMAQAVADYRASVGIRGPLFLGRDTHGLSEPAWTTTLEVLAGNGVPTLIDDDERFTPTPALSLAILRHNRGRPEDDAGRADGIVVTPSHNPPTDGGFKYNPPHGGPADSDTTSWIAGRANELLADPSGIERVGFPQASAASTTARHDFLGEYVGDLPSVVDLRAIRSAGVRIGADPMGGAAVDYWAAIADRHGLDLTVVNPVVDATWRFMTLDWDGRIRMDSSSPHAMASLIEARDSFDIATGNDADADRHGIVTPDAGLMNPNHFLAVSIDHLFRTRPGWSERAAVGKTMVSSSMIDRVTAALARRLVEVPVGFKWFVPGLLSGDIGFGGEESAGASFLRMDGGTWTTDKDGILLCLLGAEILATTGESPSRRYRLLTERHGDPSYSRIDAAAGRQQKAALAGLTSDRITVDTLAGDRITEVLTAAPGNGAPLGGIKVATAQAWFAARPSGTEDVYKVYAESFRGDDHLRSVLAEARALVDSVLETAQ
ncbi:MAG TPA: phosphoglucomutase (alpha-D-glucose-1,6-bisphosphate-dependent) [Acidimicrobiia bacterium]|nr:phosphoglucomutase (alpha-D-glucose-1,6-bisphosphate-dependent) [Acidimicrobiia bacterium]